MVTQVEIQLPSYPRGIHLITHHIQNALPPLPQMGVCQIFIQHTSAGLTINENCEPSVRHDFRNFMDKLVPENPHLYTHTAEGPDDMPAHLKSSLFGSSVSIPISSSKLNLGTWQGIYLGEFRNNSFSRRLIVTAIGE